MSPRALATGLPLSSDSSSASWSPFALIRSASAYMRLARFDGLTFRSPPSSAPRAAATARSTSSGPAKATSQIASPVAGSMVSNVRPSAASDGSAPITSGRGPPSTNSRAAGERDWAVAVAIARIVVGGTRTRPALTQSSGMALTVVNRLYRRSGLSWPLAFLALEMQSAFVITAATLGLFSFYYNSSAHDYLKILVVTMFLVAMAVGITIVHALPLMRPIQEWIGGARDEEQTEKAWQAAVSLPLELTRR